jgi:hypothetical protein
MLRAIWLPSGANLVPSMSSRVAAPYLRLREKSVQCPRIDGGLQRRPRLSKVKLDPLFAPDDETKCITAIVKRPDDCIIPY